MSEKVYINGKDARITWGMILEEGSKSKLIMGLPLKEFVENKSRLKAGKEVLYSNPVVDERDVELVFCFLKPGSFVANYNAFMSEMYKGEVSLRYVDDEMDTTYNLTYLQHRSLTTIQYAGKASIRFNEPDPTNRL